MLELTHHGLYVLYKIDGIEYDIIVQNGVGYLHKSQIGRKSGANITDNVSYLLL